MFFRCVDLFNINSFQQAKLISGEKGLFKEISWPYIKSTDSIIPWVNGKELIFILYNNENIDLYKILKESIEKDLSGIVILSSFTDTIFSSKLIELSDKNNFPIFQLPWDIKLLTLTQEIILKIQEYKEKNSESRKAFRELINSDHTTYKTIENFYSITTHNFNILGIFEDKTTENIEKFYNYYFDTILKTLYLKNIIKKEEILHFTYSNRIIFLIFIKNPKLAKEIKNIFEEIIKKILSKHKNLYLIFSEINEQKSSLKKIFEDTQNFLSLSKNKNINNQIIHCDNLSLYTFFLELNKNSNIKNILLKNIQPLLDYDAINNSNLFETLKIYFDNNNHLINASKKLYIHRNTLVYRLNLIKNLLNKDLNNSLENLELYNSILFYDFNKDNKKS